MHEAYPDVIIPSSLQRLLAKVWLQLLQEVEQSTVTASQVQLISKIAELGVLS